MLDKVVGIILIISLAIFTYYCIKIGEDKQ